jgi:hypothetical protein
MRPSGGKVPGPRHLRVRWTERIGRPSGRLVRLVGTPSGEPDRRIGASSGVMVRRIGKSSDKLIRKIEKPSGGTILGGVRSAFRSTCRDPASTHLMPPFRMFS